MNFNGGKEYSVQEIFDECKRSKLMFFSGGGVTFTGGEATMQYEELTELLKLLKSENIHTCIETNGTNEKLCELLEYIDYLIMDFKHYDSEILKKYYTQNGFEVTETKQFPHLPFTVCFMKCDLKKE